jgi:hypothetical protein
MPAIIDRRVTAQIDGEFVVFLIGMRINKPCKTHKWLPMFRAFPKMMKELESSPPDVGFLGYSNLGLTTLIQYWRSFDHLERYARASDRHHWPAWLDFNRRMKNSRGDVGIWHETFIVPAARMSPSTAACRSWASQKRDAMPRLRPRPRAPVRASARMRRSRRRQSHSRRQMAS